MATEYFLERPDGAPLGSFEEVAAFLHSLLPAIEFAWTAGGEEKLAALEGVVLPPQLRQSLARMPSLLEGTVVGEDWRVVFNLGFEEPVTRLYLIPDGASLELDAAFAALAEAAGAEFQISREG